jgi:YYY domain-containing protein
MPQTQQTNSTPVLRVGLLLLIILAGFGLRVWGINFDQGLGSHPDERSTACFYAASLRLPADWDEFWDPQRSPLNPLWDLNHQRSRSFTYGHFPLYLGMAMGELMHTAAPVAAQLGVADSTVALMARADSACDAIAVAGRLVIALLDTLTIFLLFLLGRRIFGTGAGLIAAAFYAFTAQAIQLSHFFAMDPASTTFTVLAVLGAVMMVQERSWRAVVLTGLAAGLAIASKFSALPILGVPVVAAILMLWQEQTASRIEGRVVDARVQLRALLSIPLMLVLAMVAFAVTSPYAIIDWESFIRATLVEQGRMVRGIADMPFTRQYRNTTPYLYFLQQQLAWGLWWPLGTVAALGALHSLVILCYTIGVLLYNRIVEVGARAGYLLTDSQVGYVVIWSWIIPYFGLTGAFLAKFNRYMSPLLPFVLIFAAGLIWQLWQAFKQRQEGRRQKTGAQEAIEVRASVGQRFGAFVSSSLAVLLTLIGIGGGLFWSLAYVNGVYNHEHTWITASRWIYQNVPSGSLILWELWDDALPKPVPGEPGMDMGSTGLRNIDWSPYEEDTAEKYEIMKAKLREADYVVYSSKRIYDSVDELPERYPMTNRYYQAMWSGELGFQLVQEVTSPPRLFGFVFDDRHADESWSLYDHAQVSIFKKVRDLSDAEYDAIFAGTWEQAIPWYVGEGSPLSPFLNTIGLGATQESESRGLINRIIAMVSENYSAPQQSPPEERKSLMVEPPLEQLPVVDNYRWNGIASENTWLGVIWWWLVVALLGWVAWPFAFWLFRPLRDRGYFLSRALGWLLAAWLLWILASFQLAMNSVANAWLAVAVLAVLGLAAALAQARTLGTFLRERWPLLLFGELLFAAAFLFFVRLRMGNPDIWQPWFGGEKFMEFAFLNGILRSPYFPPVNPHFAGGYINYYYFGIYLVSYLIKLTGIYAEVAFNLAIPTLFAVTVSNAFAVAYSAVQMVLPSPNLPQKGRDAGRTERDLVVEKDAGGAGNSTPVGEGWGGASLPADKEIIATPVAAAELMTGGQDEPSTVKPLVFESAMEQANTPTSSATNDVDDRNTQHESSFDLAQDRRTTNHESRLTNHADHWRYGLFAALLGPLFVAILSNLESFAQVVRNLARLSTSSFQSNNSVVQALVHAGSGLQQVWATGQPLPPYDFWGPSRVIPATINEFPYWSFLFADLHPHLIGIPFSVFFLALVLTLFFDLAGRAEGGLHSTWQRGAGLLFLFALSLGTLASVNLWELPTFLGLGVLALIVAQYRGRGRINWPVTIVLSGIYLVGAYLLYWPFFTNYVNVGASGVGLVKEGDDAGLWLLIWGFFGFILLSWLLYTAVRTGDSSGSGSERWLAGSLRNLDRLPRYLHLHRLCVSQPTLGYLITLVLVPLTVVAAVGAFLLDQTVLALCLAPLGLWWLLLWRRSRQADAGSVLVVLLAITGLALLAGTQVFFLKDFLAGGDHYRMNTLFKFFNQVWVLWAIAAAIALPRFWYGYILQQNWRQLPLRTVWGVLFTLLFAASFSYLVWGTPARLDQRFPGWRPPIGTLNGLDFMREGVFYWPDQNNPIELRHDWEAIQWVLANVRGNAVVMESSQVSYYREAGSRIASMTGLSGINGFHEGEQRYGEDVGLRAALHNEFWNTMDLVRTQQLLQELRVDLVYVGPLEQHQHPDGVQKLAVMAANGQLTPIYVGSAPAREGALNTGERSILYAVPGRLAQTQQGFYAPLGQTAMR